MHSTTTAPAESNSFSDELLAAINPDGFDLDAATLATLAIRYGREIEVGPDGTSLGADEPPCSEDEYWEMGLSLGLAGYGWAQPPADLAADLAAAFEAGLDTGLAGYYSEAPDMPDDMPEYVTTLPGWGASID